VLTSDEARDKGGLKDLALSQEVAILDHDQQRRTCRIATARELSAVSDNERVAGIWPTDFLNTRQS
jgi:hypothetical protein